MSEKPVKRLVSWAQYLRTLLGKGGLYSIALVVGVLGLSILMSIVFDVDSAVSENAWSGISLFLVFNCLMMGSIGLATLWCSTVFFKGAKKVEAVAPITRSNTADLPVTETLVRPSDLPFSHQRSELLRAAPQGSETPPEDLLRAAAGSGQEAS